jgi:hypothetical protein
MMAFQALRRAYNTDVAPIIAKARVEAGGAIDVLGVYRDSRWRDPQGAGTQGRRAGRWHCVTKPPSAFAWNSLGKSLGSDSNFAKLRICERSLFRATGAHGP